MPPEIPTRIEVQFKGTFTKQSFFTLLDAIDKMQRDGYIFVKQMRSDDNEWYVTIDYVMMLTK